MAKARTIAFFCKEYGYEFSKWIGQCSACKEWNPLVEELASKTSAGSPGRMGGGSPEPVALTVRPSLLSEIDLDEQDRIPAGFRELDWVLGDGIVAGSLALVGEGPGMGKSTLPLQVCRHLAGAGQKVLYISDEESLKQIKMRINRIGSVTGELKFLYETNLEHIEQAIDAEKPQTVVIDSIQITYREKISSAPGSVSQVRGSVSIPIQIAKSRGIAILVVGHVTKEGAVAGPRVSEHMVDTVLYFERDRHASHRILRSVKNRFGSTSEIGVFEMQEEGPVEVENFSKCMLDDRPEEALGAVVSCPSEGTRPILLEAQALVTETNLGMPRRTVAGTDYNRANLLTAVLEKWCRYEMSYLDAYVNTAGGMKVNEPVLDLAIVIAITSSYKDRLVNPKMLIFREVGLSGEVRAVSQAGQRVSEATKLGSTSCILPKVCADKIEPVEGTKIIGVANVREAIDVIQESGSGQLRSQAGEAQEKPPSWVALARYKAASAALISWEQLPP